MHIFIYFIIIFYIILNCLNLNVNGQLKGKLVFAHILFRHGDRTPVDLYPNDPWNDLKFWPTGWGQLTNIGKMQHYELGNWLKERYKSIINSTYLRDSIYIQSTDVDRTLMSALSNLAGFFPPENSELWNTNIDWQPIPVHTIPEKLDYILSGKKPCNAYDYAVMKLKQTNEFKNYDKRFKSLYKYLTNHTGIIVDSIEGVQRINNTLFIEELYNKTLPEWTKSVYPGGDMEFISSLSMATCTYTKQLARLKIGPLVKEILNRFKKKSNLKLKPNRSIWIYSGHDTTVANLLNSLKLFELHSPPYAACILLELRILKNKPLVSIFYKNTTEEPEPLEIPNCGIQCPLDDMFKLYNEILPDNWESECKISTLSMTYEEADVGFAMEILIVIGIILISILIYVMIVFYRRKNYIDFRFLTEQNN